MSILKQWNEAKSRNPGYLFVFRNRQGTRYALYQDDADMVSPIVDIPVIIRSDGMRYVDFALSELEVILRKILKKRLRVAICDPIGE